MIRLAVCFLFAAAAFGQPFVYYRGAVNAASFLPPGLPNGAIARGSMFSIFGRGLGPGTPQLVSAFPLQTSLGGVSVELTQGAVTVDALPVFVSAGQLNVILPSNTPLGALSLRVRYGGTSSNPIPIEVVASSIGVFSVNGGGFGPGIVQNFVSQADQPVNSLSATARPGQTEILWGTGLGAAPFPDSVAPTPGSLATPVEVYVGGKRAAVAYAGRTPCCASIDQIVFTVPADAPAGCYVPLVVRTDGAVVSNTVTMAIHPTGAPCSDAHHPLTGQPRSGGRIAVAQLFREAIRVDRRTSQPYDVVLDSLLAAFRESPPSDFQFSALTALPPRGTCAVYAGAASRMIAPASAFAPPGSQLSPGSPLRVQAGAMNARVSNSSGFEGTFFALLGGQNPVQAIAPAPLLNTGPFTLSGPGGAVTAAFSAMLDNVSPVNWTNRDQVSTVRRTQDLTLTWAGSPGASRGVAIVGVSERTPSDAQAMFVCMGAEGAGSATIPAYVLGALPASAANDFASLTRISIGNVPAGSAALPGFDATALGVSSWTSKTVVTE
jgi:uncharacterized protein (TIGR03437 family)